MEDVSPWVALVGGLASLLSPCTLPMIPVYLASLAGPEILDGGVRGHRLSIFFHALAFFFGFAVIFVLLGMGAGFIGATVSSHSVLVRQISGALLVLFGVFMIASLKVPWLNIEKRVTAGTTATGYARATLTGIIFALAWTPCAGPVLGSILTLAFNSESGSTGAGLLVIYSAGIGLPLIGIGLAFDWIAPLLKKVRKYAVWWYLASGVILIVMGVLVILNKIRWFSG